ANYDTTVTVSGVNDAPTDLALSGNSVTENAATGTVVGTVTGTDPDSGDIKTYSLTDTAGGRFAINSSTGVITVANGSLLNYESATSHTVTVRVTDSGGLTYDEAFAINLTNVNEAPTGADATVTINEDTSHTFTSANFGFSDVDVGDALSAVRIDTLPGSGTLTLSGAAVTAGQVVTVADITAGNVVFTPAVNANGVGYATLTFSVRDSTNGYDAAPNSLTFDVTAVNDAPTLTAGTVSNLIVSEDAGLASLGLGGVAYSPSGGADESGQTLSYAVTAIPSASIGNVFLADGTTRVTVGSYSLADIQGMQFKPTANASGVTAFQFNVYDSGGTANGGANNISQFILITVNAVNDASTITNLSGDSLSYSEGDGAVVIEQSGNALVADVDSANLDTGTLTVSIPAGGDSAEDVLSIQNQGTGAGQIGVSGSSITYGGVTIGTFTGGSNGSDLVITLNSTATPTRVTALVKNITYENTDTAAPTTGARTVRYVLTDGDGGTSANYDTTVTVSGVNDAPAFSNLNGMPTYTEGGAAVVLDADVTIYDGELSTLNNFNGATLTLARHGGADAQDVFYSGAGTLSLWGGNMNVSGITIGTYISGAGSLELTFNSNATQALVNSAMQQITYHNTSDTPPASVQVDWTFDDGNSGSQGSGGTLTATGSTTVTITATNDAPVITPLGPDVTFVEGGMPQVFDATGNIVDADSANFDGGVLTISISTNGTADDRLIVGNWGTGPGQVGTSGSNVTYEGVVIGTASGGTSGSDPLVVTFNTSATPSAVQEVYRSIQFENVSDAPSTATRQLTIGLTDGDGGTATPQTKLVYVQVTNDAPVMTFGEGDKNFTEGALAVIIDALPNVSDLDSTNFDTGTLTITISANPSVDDRVELLNAGMGAGQIGVSGTNVYYGGTLIGTQAGGIGAVPFVVTFNANADASIVGEVMANIRFWVAGDAPSTATRTVEAVLIDGDGGTSLTASKQITVTGVNDAPTITSLSGDSLSYSEGDGAVVIEQGGNALVADVDSANLDTGTLTVSIPAGGDSAEDVLSIQNQGTGAGQIGVSGSNITYGGVTIGTFTGGSNGSDLVITLNSSATPACVTALVKNITYENTDTAAPTTGARTVRYVLTDGDGGTSANYDTTVTVSGVNDAPVAVADTLTVAEDSGTTSGTLATNDTPSGDGGNVWALATGATNGTAVVNANGSYSYTPTANYNGPDSFTYTLTDADGDVSTATVTITVTAVDDAPTLTANTGSTVAEGGSDTINSGELSVGDIDNVAAQLTFSVGTGPTFGRLELTTSPGVSATSFTQADIIANRLVYVHDGSETASDTFTFTVNDGAGGTVGSTTVTLTITPVNDAPTIISGGGGATASVNVAENVTGIMVVTGADVDLPAQTLTYGISGGADQALFTIDVATGALSFVAPHDFEVATDANGDNVYVVQVRVVDSQGGAITQAIQVTVTDVTEGMSPGPVTTSILPSLIPTTLPPIPGTPTSRPLPAGPESPTVPVPNSLTRTGVSGIFSVPPASHPDEGPPGAAFKPDELRRTDLPVKDHSLPQWNDDQPSSPFTIIPVEVAGNLQFEEPNVPNIVSDVLMANLDAMATSLEEALGVDQEQHALVARVAALTGLTLSVGFVAWALQSSTLLASCLATLPAWRSFDPLPVVSLGRRERNRLQKATDASQQHEQAEFDGLQDLFDIAPSLKPKA
ncbi:MAG: tandem-95 repeat protein, partial [Nitrospira sp.]